MVQLNQGTIKLILIGALKYIKTQFCNPYKNILEVILVKMDCGLIGFDGISFLIPFIHLAKNNGHIF
jgi:hypothetical protein